MAKTKAQKEADIRARDAAEVAVKRWGDVITNLTAQLEETQTNLEHREVRLRRRSRNLAVTAQMRG